MNRVTKNAPFGTDNTPVLEYKIVGGKRVEVIAKNDSSMGHNQERLKRKNMESPSRGPHGTPSMLTQPIFRDYEYSDLQQGYSTAKQHEVAREITSYTSPFGDRTMSFRHGVPKMNRLPVLPPIRASQPPGNDFVDLVSKEDLQVKNNNGDVSDSYLETVVSNRLHGFHSLKLKDMYVELTGFDRHLTGIASESQLGLVALRHDLPLKLSTLKLLYHKFADPQDRHKINYEKFLQFLASCMSRANTTNPDVSKSAHSIYSDNEQNPEADKDAKRTPDQSPSLHVDEKLVSLLKEQLTDCDDFDIFELKKELASADKLSNGELPADAISQICVNQRVPLTSSVITKMLQQAEIANGIVNWISFLSPLMIACSQLKIGGVDWRSPAPSQPLEALSASTTKQSKVSDRGSRASCSGSNTEVNGHSSVGRSEKLSLRDQLSAGWDEREPRGRPQQFSNNDAPIKLDATGFERGEMWMRNFTRLAHALRSYHPFKSDILPRGEVERMVGNYNLIYGLGFSAHELSDAVKRAIIGQSQDDDQETVSVDRLLSNLLEKKT